MTPGQYNITVQSNATYSQALTYLDASGATVDLTGYSAKMDIRHRDGSLILTLSTDNGMIVVGPAAPNITLTIPVATMKTLVSTDGVYDLVLTSAGGVATALLAGAFLVIGGVTQ